MAKIEVTLSEMTGTANQVKKACDDFLESAGKVITAAEALSHTWEGDSQTAFIAEQQRANAWYKEMMNLVANYVSSLDSAAQLYENTDEESAAAIRSC